MENSKDEKNLISAPDAQNAAEAAGEETLAFAARISQANEKTRSRYNAVKNALFAYRSADGKQRVRSQLTVYGEEFYLGGKLLARIRLVRGYVRLFLALNPLLYPADKYQFRDMGGSPRYSDCPVLINICSEQRIRAAYSLIIELMRKAGAMPEKLAVSRDCSADFANSAASAQPAFSIGEMTLADAEIPDDDIMDDIPDPVENPRKGGKRGEAPPSAIPVERFAGQEDGTGAALYGYIPAPFGQEAPTKVRLPRRAKVVDAEGEKIGKVRRSTWYDLDGNRLGTFSRHKDGSVYLYEGDETRKGFLDRNDNVISLSNDYMATLRRFPTIILIVLLAIILAATVLSAVLSSHIISQSGNENYAPVLFIADEDGTEWADTENLKVFDNELFGTEAIAPGMRGEYQFILRNENPDQLKFDLEFECENDYGIDLVYRIYRDGTCIYGGQTDDEMLSVGEFDMFDMTAQAESDTLFMIEWYWRDNDPVDTEAGQNGAQYTLKITFTAEVAAFAEENDAAQ